MKVGDIVIAQDDAELKAGNRLLIGNIPVGQTIYNLELIVGQ